MRQRDRKVPAASSQNRFATKKDLADFRADVDRRFEQVDGRFEQIDQRFEQIDLRLGDLRRHFDVVAENLKSDLLTAFGDLVNVVSHSSMVLDDHEVRIRRLERN